MGIFQEDTLQPSTIVDATGVNAADVSAAGALKIDGSAVFQPALIYPSVVPTFSAAIIGLAPAANTSDFFTITGSATKTIIVTKIRIGGTQTLTGAKDIYVLKRSTANAGGTSIIPTSVSHDSNDAASAVVRAYTANPTVGTLVGVLRAIKMSITAPGTVGDDIEISFSHEFAKGIVLRGTSQVMSLHGNGVSFAGGANLDISIEWVEQ